MSTSKFNNSERITYVPDPNRRGTINDVFIVGGIYNYEVIFDDENIERDSSINCVWLLKY